MLLSFLKAKLVMFMQAKLEREIQSLKAKMEMAFYKDTTLEPNRTEDLGKLSKLQVRLQTLQQALKSMEDIQQAYMHDLYPCILCMAMA